MEVKEILQYFCKLSQNGAAKAVSMILSSHYEEVEYNSQFLIAHGDIPVALVAHLDTVHRTPCKTFFIDQEKDVIWSPEGLGGDDRAGIAAIIDLVVNKGLRPHIIFTYNEECGGVGAQALVRTHPVCPFKDLRYIVELDRQGKDDCVFYNCNNLEFEKYVETFGFSTNIGTFSDISIICPTWGIAGVNLSIGYVNEHSLAEYLVFPHFYNTIKKVTNMLNEPKDEIPEFNYIKSTTGYFSGKEFEIPCDGCHKMIDYWEMVDIYGEQKEDTITLCYNCFSKINNISLCKTCNNWYFERKNKTICAECEEKSKK